MQARDRLLCIFFKRVGDHDRREYFASSGKKHRRVARASFLLERRVAPDKLPAAGGILHAAYSAADSLALYRLKPLHREKRNVFSFRIGNNGVRNRVL